MPDSTHSPAPQSADFHLEKLAASGAADPIVDGNTLRGPRNYAQSIVANVRAPIVVLDATLRVRTASGAFYKHFRVTPTETEGRHFYDLGNRQWNIAALRTLIEEVLPRQTVVEDYEVRHTFEQLGPRVMQISAHRLSEAPDDERLIILSIDDITERRRGEALMTAQKEAFEMAAAGTPLLGVLEFLIRAAESQSQARMAIHLLDEAGAHFAQTAAASLPPSYGAAVEGMAVNSMVGTCCAAVVRRERVVVRDVAACREFPKFAELALAQGIHAAWSTPIFSSTGKVLGTFVCYYSEPREPVPQDDSLGKIVTQTSALLIEREQAVEARARLAAIVESSDDAIIGKDLDGIITSWNAGAERLFGYTAQEIIGQSITLLIPPERLSEETDILGHIRKGEPVEHFETIRRRKDGTLLDISLTASPIVGAAGKIVGASKIARDITASKRAAEALRASEARYRSIIDSSPDCIKILDLQGNLLALEAGLELLGISDITPLLGKSWIDFWVRDDDRSAARAAVAAAAAGGNGHFVGFFRTLHGLDKWWDVAITPVCDGAGQPVRLIAVSRDVTERHEMEQMLAARASELLQADRSKDEFLAMLAHELRNPLAPLRNAAEILKDPGVTDDEQLQAQRIIGRQIENMSRMIDDLLDVSRITEGKIELKRNPVSLEAILTSATTLARAGCAGRGQDLAVSMPAEAIFLNADGTRLEQVFGNLLTNASKYGGDGCHIAVRAERAGGEVAVRVIDNGAGIAPELLPRIFDLFVQSSRTPDRAHGGLGIGLTLVQRLVRLHGGSIEARSEGLGKGAEFIVRLPILMEAPAIPPQPPAPAARVIPRRILVVDDNIDSARTWLYFRPGAGIRRAPHSLVPRRLVPPLNSCPKWYSLTSVCPAWTAWRSHVNCARCPRSRTLS